MARATLLTVAICSQKEAKERLAGNMLDYCGQGYVLLIEDKPQHIKTVVMISEDRGKLKRLTRGGRRIGSRAGMRREGMKLRGK